MPPKYKKKSMFTGQIPLDIRKVIITCRIQDFEADFP